MRERYKHFSVRGSTQVMHKCRQCLRSTQPNACKATHTQVKQRMHKCRRPIGKAFVNAMVDAFVKAQAEAADRAYNLDPTAARVKTSTDSPYNAAQPCAQTRARPVVSTYTPSLCLNRTCISVCASICNHTSLTGICWLCSQCDY